MTNSGPIPTLAQVSQPPHVPVRWDKAISHILRILLYPSAPLGTSPLGISTTLTSTPLSAAQYNAPLGASPRLRSLRHRSVQRGTAVLDCETWANPNWGHLRGHENPTCLSMSQNVRWNSPAHERSDTVVPNYMWCRGAHQRNP